jgi:hypothetical protein
MALLNLVDALFVPESASSFFFGGFPYQRRLGTAEQQLQWATTGRNG